MNYEAIKQIIELATGRYSEHFGGFQLAALRSIQTRSSSLGDRFQPTPSESRVLEVVQQKLLDKGAFSNA